MSLLIASRISKFPAQATASRGGLEVNQRRRLECVVGTLAPEVGSGDAAQLFV